ncbi:MAG: DoxX family protein [Bacteroidetes bacterium]|nr:DoxX family protein [Bacteroidota bacterium]
MKNFLLIVRWVVGLLFIFSGLVKANDPLGLSYKMQEFFEVWGWSALHDYTLAFSLMMNVFEVVTGIAVIIGWQIRTISWLLLALIIFFTFLTGYALFSGKIKTCGCFGDCLPLTAAQSFTKDLVLLVLIIILCIYRNNIQVAISNPFAIAIILISLNGTGWLQNHVLRHLPFVDCLPYKKGNNILDQMKTPKGAIADSFALNFIYKKNGQELKFDQAHFPADFDSTYIYVDRTDVLAKKGNSLKAAIADFSLQTISGVDSTATVFENKQYLLVLAKDFTEWASWQKSLDTIIKAAQSNQIPIILVTADASTAQQHYANLPILRCDATVLKTAARVNPTIFFMQKANIVFKYSYRDSNKIMQQILNWK